MWASERFINQCYELHKLGVELRIDAGRRIARGFADVGFEEYYVLPGSRMVSLLNGRLMPLPPEEERFFFVVPTTDELAVEIDKLGVDILRIDCEERRHWVVHWRAAGAAGKSSKGADLEEALLLTLREAHQLSSGKGSLKVM